MNSQSTAISRFIPETYCSVFVTPTQATILTAVKVWGIDEDRRKKRSHFALHALENSDKIAQEAVANILLNQVNDLAQKRKEESRYQQPISGIYLNSTWAKQAIRQKLSTRQKSEPHWMKSAFTLTKHYFRETKLTVDTVQKSQMLLMGRVENGEFSQISPKLISELQEWRFEEAKGLSSIPTSLGAFTLLMHNVGNDRPSAAAIYLRAAQEGKGFI